MKVGITIQHPAHVHFFRNVYDKLSDGGHTVRVFAREKEMALELLDMYGIPYTPLASEAESTLGLIGVQLQMEYRLFRATKQFDPEVLTAIGGVAVSQVAPLVGARSVAFLDTEGALVNYVTSPLADVVCTPRQFRTDLPGDHRKYDGYHELAYLHPDQFDPDREALASAGVDPDQRFFVLRFVGWDAHHDIGHSGFSPESKRRLVDFLDDRGAVYISHEGTIPRDLREYRLPVSPHRIHDLLAEATLYVGDSGTMATEAAVLGTPAVRSSSQVGDDDMSNFLELESEYELLFSFEDDQDALELVRDLVSRHDLGREWSRRREKLLADKVDVADFVVETLLGVGER